MKSSSKFLSAATLALAATMTVGCMQTEMVDQYPSQTEIQAREIHASHRLNTCPMGVSKIDVIIRFATGSDKLSPRAAAEVQKVAAMINDPSFQGGHVTVEGYTDAQGKDAANLDLSYRRAMTVMHALTEDGVSESMLSAQGFGKANPVATNSTPAGRAANRRVVFVVSK